MTTMAALARIAAAALRAAADELDPRGGDRKQQRRDLTGTTDATVSLSSRVTNRRPGRRYQPEKRFTVGFTGQARQDEGGGADG